mgnify:CR=1 FL=1
MDKKKKINSVNRRNVTLLRDRCHDVTLHRDYKKRGKEYKRKINRDNWVVSNTRYKKVQVDLNQKIKADPQGKLVLYNDTLAQKYKEYLMTTKAAKYSVRIYAGDQLIYQYSDSNFHRNDQMKSKLSCDARIPEQGKKEPLSRSYIRTEATESMILTIF